MNNIITDQTINEIRALGLNLAIDQTMRGVCPACGGEHTNSFVLTRTEDGLLYICHRAMCGLRGFIPSKGHIKYNTKKQTKLPKIFAKPLQNLSQDTFSTLEAFFGLTEQEVNDNGIKYSFMEERLYLPIYNAAGLPIGGTSRALWWAINEGEVRKKALNYIENPNSWNGVHYPPAFFTWAPDRPIALVEDHISAIKMSRYGRCCALLGTHLSIAGAIELAKKTNHLIFCLDADTWQGMLVSPAHSKGFQLAKKYGVLFNKVTVRYLAKDPKNMEDKDLPGLFIN